MGPINNAGLTPEEDRFERDAGYWLDWFDAWNQAWDWSESQGLADGIYGAEYRRTTGEALIDAVPISQAGMRAYIRLLANAPTTQSITAESLKRRETKRLTHPEDN